MEAERRASRRWLTVLGWPTVSALVGGVTVGWLMFIAGCVVYLALVFPLGMAFAGGSIITWAITRGKLRNVFLGAAFGLLTGVFIFATYHYLRYTSFRQGLYDYLSYRYQDELEDLEFEERQRWIEQTIDRALSEKYGSPGMLGYLNAEASLGIPLVSHLGKEDLRANLGGELGTAAAWIYLLVEFITVAGLTLVAGSVAAGRPFCGACDEWAGPQHFCPGERDIAAAIAYVDAGPHYAGFWPRCWALLIDCALLALTWSVGVPLLVVVTTLVAGSFGGLPPPRDAAVGQTLTWSLLGGLTWFYFVCMESSSCRGTLGKMAMRLTVVTVTGQPLSFWRSSFRSLARLLSVLTLGVGLIMADLSPKNQALHDRLAGTVVLKTGG